MSTIIIALQRTIIFSKLDLGLVNRGQSVNIGIGGKGQDVIIASTCMNVEPGNSISLVQFLGQGPEGDYLSRLLREKTASSAHTDYSDLSTRTIAPCRTCITLVDNSSNEVTEIIEPSGTATRLCNVPCLDILLLIESKF